MKDLFYKYQPQLLKLANNRFGRKFLEIESKNKIVGLLPNAYIVEKGNKLAGTFRGYSLYAKKLRYALTAIDLIKNPQVRRKDKYQGLPTYQGLLNYVGLLKDNRFPLVMLDTDTFFAGAGDGTVARTDVSTWSNAHDTAAGDETDDTSTVTNCRAAVNVPGNYWCDRMIFPIDTSALTAAATISSADFKFYQDGAGGPFGATSFGVVESNPAATNNIEVGDFDEVGESAGSGFGNAKNTDIIEGATRLSATTANTAHTAALDATGIGFISLTAFSKFGLRINLDLDNTTPVQASLEVSASVRCSEYAATEFDPNLFITFSAGGARRYYAPGIWR